MAFRRNVSAPSSGLKSKPNKKLDDLKMETVCFFEMSGSLQPAWSYNQEIVCQTL